MTGLQSRKLLSVQNPKSIVGMWLFAIVWCGISFPIFWAFAFQARDFMGGAIGGLFSLIGLAMLYATVKMSLEYAKYGRVHLTLEGESPAAGSDFSARLDLPGDAASTAATIHAELACVQATWSRGSKGGASKSERDAWTGKKVFPVRRGATGGGYASLHFDVPAEQPASDLPEESPPDAMLEVGHPAGIEIGRSYYRWELRVKADVPGIDLDRTFKLRVAPGRDGAGARPRIAPVVAPRPSTSLAPDFERRIETRREAERKLGRWCAFVGVAPFLSGFAIAGIAIGLAGCPMGWKTGQPPVCEFAGIDWGWFMAKGFDAMFVAVPAGIAGSALLRRRNHLRHSARPPLRPGHPGAPRQTGRKATRAIRKRHRHPQRGAVVPAARLRRGRSSSRASPTSGKTGSLSRSRRCSPRLPSWKSFPPARSGRRSARKVARSTRRSSPAGSGISTGTGAATTRRIFITTRRTAMCPRSRYPTSSATGGLPVIPRAGWRARARRETGSWRTRR